MIKISYLKSKNLINFERKRLSDTEIISLKKYVREEALWEYSSLEDFSIYEERILKLCSSYSEGSDLFNKTLSNYYSVRGKTYYLLYISNPTDKLEKNILLSYSLSFIFETYRYLNSMTAPFADKIFEDARKKLRTVVKSIYDIRNDFNDTLKKDLSIEEFNFIPETCIEKEFCNLVKEHFLEPFRTISTDERVINIYYSPTLLFEEKCEILEEIISNKTTYEGIPLSIIENIFFSPASIERILISAKGKKDINPYLEQLSKRILLLKKYKEKFKYYSPNYIEYCILKTKIDLQFESANNDQKVDLYNEQINLIKEYTRKVSSTEYIKLTHEELFIAMSRDFIKLRSILQKPSELFTDSQNLQQERQITFDYLRRTKEYIEKEILNSSWYNNKDFIEESEENRRLKLIIDYANIFLNGVIVKEQYEFLMDKDRFRFAWEKDISRNLVNLNLSKFTMKSLGISISNETRDYYLEDLWNSLFIRYILKDKTIWKFEKYDEYDREEQSRLSKERELCELINSGETYRMEFKSSFWADTKAFIEGNNVKSINQRNSFGEYLKEIVAMLNSKGGIILIGIWEKDKARDFLLTDNGNAIVFREELREYCITGIDLDQKVLENKYKKKITLDFLLQKFEESYEKYIIPSLTEIPEVKFRDLYGKKIAQIQIPKGKQEYYLKDENGKERFYIRKNSKCIALEGKDLVSYIKNKNT